MTANAETTNPLGRFTRTGIRRSGDDYQDLCALELLVEMLEHPERYRWIKVEADEAGALDDVLALREDGGFVARQVKYSGHPDEESDAWTWEKLLAEREHSGSKSPSLLCKWFRSWQQLSAQGTVAEASLESNRKAEETLNNIIGPNGAIPVERIPTDIWDEITRQMADEDDAKAFFSEFRFRVDKPELNVLEDGLIRRFFALSGTHEGWLSLKDQLRRWVRERYQPRPDGSINIKDVRAAADWYGLKALPEDFEVPSDYTLPSQTFHDNFFQAVVQRIRGCQVLAAPPALGKSTYLSYLVGQLQEADVAVIRHHYFLTLDDRSRGRLDHNPIAESLMNDLMGSYPEALGELASKNPTPEDLGACLEGVGAHFAAQGKVLVVIIDGLDHVWRERNSRDELVLLFEHLLPAPSGVVLVVGTQPVDENQLPPILPRECPREQWTQLEPLDQDAVAAWLENQEDGLLDLPSQNQVKQSVLDDLASAFYAKTEGHPLHLRFVLASLLERGQGVNPREIADLPGAPGKDIMAYYSALWASLPETGRRILHLLACTNFPWPLTGFAEALDPEGRDLVEVNNAFRQVRHLLVNTPLGLQPFHSSLLIFVRSEESHSTYRDPMHGVARQWLTSASPDYWKWAYSWLLEAEVGNASALIDGPNRAWVIESLISGYPRDQISEILGRSAWAAIENGQLARFVELALLRDYLEWGEHQPLLHVQLALGHDERLKDISLAKVDNLDLFDIVSLARYEARKGNYAVTRQCLDALSRRSPNEGNYDQVVIWARSVSVVVALLSDIKLERLLTFLQQFRGSGRSVMILDAFAGCMRLEQNMPGLRELLTASDLSEDELVVARQHAVALAFETSIQIGLPDLQVWNDPFSSAYRCFRSQEYEPGPSAFYPSWSLLNRHEDFSFRINPIIRFFKLAFYALLSSKLREENATIEEWIALAPTPYVVDLLRRINILSGDVAAATKSRDSLPFSVPYRHFEGAEFPNRWSDREAGPIAEGIQMALSEIAFDLVYLQREWTGNLGTASAAEVQVVFSSRFADSWEWIDSYIRYAKPFLPDSTITWIIDNLESDTDGIVDSFPTQAEKYAKLATLSTVHDRGQDEIERLLAKAVSRTISYGYHKDMLIYSMLDISEACHRGGIEGGEDWLLSMAPTIAHVKDFTDGDETRYFPQKLGEVLASVAPNWLPNYYIWLSGLEEFVDARSVFNNFMRVADLADPVVRAIASTGVDNGSLHVLRERAEGGDPLAAELLSEVISLFGFAPDEPKETPIPYVPEIGNDAGEGEPNAKDYPPPQINEFLYACNAKRPHESSKFIKAWLETWDINQQGLQAYEAVKELAGSGYDVRNGDLIADLARRFEGLEEAYLWIAAANREDFGWFQFITEKERTLTRWRIIRDSYPDHWIRFIQDTITRNQMDRWSGVAAHGSVSRLTEYCIELGHFDEARALAEVVLATVHDLTSSAPLASPTWLGRAGAQSGDAA